MIDSRLLPKGDLKTRWIRYVPNKVNTFAWKVMTNSLPTRFNISRRGIDIESLSCVNCDVGIETNDHLFFACNTAKKISKLINRWWDVPFMDINSYGEWRSWIDNVKLPKKNKSMFQDLVTPSRELSMSQQDIEAQPNRYAILGAVTACTKSERVNEQLAQEANAKIFTSRFYFLGLLAEVVVLEEEEVLLEEENVSYKHVFKPTEVANSRDICGNGSGIGLQHGSQLFGVPNVGPNVTTVDIGPSVSPVSVATLDVTGNNDALGLRVSQNIQVVAVSLSVLPAGVDNRDLSDKYYCIGLNISPKRQCVRGLNSVPSDNLSYVYLIKTCGGSQLRVAPVGRINRSTTISGQHDGNAQHCVHGGTSSNQQSGSRQLADRSYGLHLLIA
ncbi:RNA-directed DNA polymerase, eukaryota [Tanacetum coccineum]|uniref:RNA-directed DNA polymerase, eukaryota n=1 Tax=Tanacetum coccineum TaxID=301880 RepID=A0ABQ5EYG0_9ASTR